MRFHSIHLQWFRGAAVGVDLDLSGKSVAVYGVNGAGKSSFVDAIEALLNGGRIGHLSHEYSGRNQEKGIINTLRPAGQQSRAEITMVGGSSAAAIWQAGAPALSSKGTSSLKQWDYRRTVLRQEELADFITSTKGQKYSAVLPLLGLAKLEAAADNLHKLIRAIERKGDLSGLRAKLASADQRRREIFGNKTDQQLIDRLEQLRLAYIPALPVESEKKTAADVLSAIDDRISSLNADQRRAATIGEIGSSDLAVRLAKVTEATARIAEIAEPLIEERLAVLNAAGSFVAVGSGAEGTLPCPACGQEIEIEEFRTHVVRERERLSAAQKLYSDQKSAIEELCDEVARLRSIAAKGDLVLWREALPAELNQAVKYLVDLSVSELRKACRTSDVFDLNTKVAPLIARAVEDAKALPLDVQTLIEHQNEARGLLDSLKATAQRPAIHRADALIDLIKNLEAGVREEIAARARETFESISADIRRYWKVLQPKDSINDVRLVVPDDNDKAVEVALRFYGKEQDSPRLTLSEGQRNALGLCIFLAMANKASDEDRPVVLDDVVISFDREHRSRVGVLLQQYFSGRQIVLFTHDREWYFELQRIFASKQWRFYRLRPYTTPSLGISFADHGMDIAAARARAKTEPEEALANIRRLMDVALSEIAERIGLPLPHLRGDDNDHRTAGQFLVALERAATKSFKRKSGEVYIQNTEALAAIKKTKPQLATWGNRGTHSFSGSTTEAEELIDGCEAVLSAFTCEQCQTALGVFEAKGGKIECRCGALQWRSE